MLSPVIAVVTEWDALLKGRRRVGGMRTSQQDGCHLLLRRCGTFKPHSPSVARYVWCGICIYGTLDSMLCPIILLSCPDISSVLVISM